MKHLRPKERLARARALRKGNNKAEAIMWNCLKAKQLAGHKFVRQFPLGPYFADFAQRTLMLVIEIDGSQHSENAYDELRNSFMRSQGYAVLRFWSTDVMRNSHAVCDTILAALHGEFQAEVRSTDLTYLPPFLVHGPSPARMRSPPLP